MSAPDDLERIRVAHRQDEHALLVCIVVSLALGLGALGVVAGWW